MNARQNGNNVWIVIPAFHAEDTIVGVVQGLNNHGYGNIVVVDDGSKDRTYEVACSLPVHVLRHFVNRGQGAALQTGVSYAVLQNPSTVVMFDADGQHRAEDIPALLAPVLDGSVDIALGSRFLSKERVSSVSDSYRSVPLFRKMILKGGAFLVFLFNGLWLTDSHNGFRCLSPRATRELDITSDRMEHASEMIEIIKRKRWRFVEVPIVVVYSDDTLRRGHGGIVQAFRVLAKMVWRKFFK